ncbi:MAG TPA: hypothetical protein VM659_02300 [Dongiaceae bacterium]|nr:hypothetical protein [Dongiaceae bacterium]
MDQTEFTLRPKLMLMLLVPLALVFFPTTAVVTTGMIPTLVALVIDGSPRRYLTITVGGLNLVGCSYFLHLLWAMPQGLSSVLVVLGSSYGWLYALLGAGCGWLLFLGMPPIIRSIAGAQAKIRLYRLNREMERMVEDWGPEVTSRTDAPAGARK